MLRDLGSVPVITGPYQLPGMDSLSPGQRNVAFHKVGVHTSCGHTHGGGVSGGVGTPELGVVMSVFRTEYQDSASAIVILVLIILILWVATIVRSLVQSAALLKRTRDGCARRHTTAKCAIYRGMAQMVFRVGDHVLSTGAGMGMAGLHIHGKRALGILCTTRFRLTTPRPKQGWTTMVLVFSATANSSTSAQM